MKPEPKSEISTPRADRGLLQFYLKLLSGQITQEGKKIHKLLISASYHHHHQAYLLWRDVIVQDFTVWKSLQR
jgi:hypothetical protein